MRKRRFLPSLPSSVKNNNRFRVENPLPVGSGFFVVGKKAFAKFFQVNLQRKILDTPQGENMALLGTIRVLQLPPDLPV